MKQWTKPGVKTSEFKVAMAATLLQGLQHIMKFTVLPQWATPIIWGLYFIARGMAKMGGPEIEN